MMLFLCFLFYVAAPYLSALLFWGACALGKYSLKSDKNNADRFLSYLIIILLCTASIGVMQLVLTFAPPLPFHVHVRTTIHGR